MMIGVTLDRVSKTFGGAKGVEEVDVHINPGEFLPFWVRAAAAKRPLCA